MKPQSRGARLGSRAVAFAFVILAVVLLCAGLAMASFTDVNPGQDYSEAIAELSSLGIINGFTDGSFRPRDPVTRQQFAKMIALTLGLQPTENNVCPFTDVEISGPGSLYPDNFVAVVAELGITNGISRYSFKPGDNISRAQVITMIVRAAPMAEVNLTQPSTGYYDDPRHVMSNFNDSTHGLNSQIAEANGLLWGIRLDAAGVWDPWRNATRGEVAQMLYRLREKMAPPSTTTTTETPNYDPLVYDNFSDPGSGWAEETYEESWIEYYSGNGGDFYRIGMSAADQETMSWYGREFEDVYTEVYAWPYPASGSWEYGFVFGLQDSSNFYELAVTGDDTAQLWKREDGYWTQMSQMVDLPPASENSNGWRLLSVQMVGSNFAAWVDDTFVGEFTDYSFPSGKLGFYVSTYDAADFTAYFDEFTVWPIIY